MKKTITFLLICILIASACLLSACNIFKNGSEDEIAGIYGIEDYYYKDVDNVTTYFADTYDYYLIVLYEDKSAKCLYKKTGGEKYSYDFTYSLTFDSDGKTVTLLNLEGCKVTTHYKNSNGIVLPSDNITTLELRPMREDLVYHVSSPTLVNKVLRMYSNRIVFHKMYNRITDKKIERAKTKQTNNRENRTGNDDDKAEISN